MLRNLFHLEGGYLPGSYLDLVVFLWRRLLSTSRTHRCAHRLELQHPRISQGNRGPGASLGTAGPHRPTPPPLPASPRPRASRPGLCALGARGRSPGLGGRPTASRAAPQARPAPAWRPLAGTSSVSLRPRLRTPSAQGPRHAGPGAPGAPPARRALGSRARSDGPHLPRGCTSQLPLPGRFPDAAALRPPRLRGPSLRPMETGGRCPHGGWGAHTHAEVTTGQMRDRADQDLGSSVQVISVPTRVKEAGHSYRTQAGRPTSERRRLRKLNEDFMVGSCF